MSDGACLLSCHKLEKLHLYCNEIEKIGGLENCIVLKELNLSSNLVSSIENLSRQVHLHSLFISANPIEQLSQISSLAQLPALRKLFLACDNFGVSPVTQTPGYRNYVL